MLMITAIAPWICLCLGVAIFVLALTEKQVQGLYPKAMMALGAVLLCGSMLGFGERYFSETANNLLTPQAPPAERAQAFAQVDDAAEGGTAPNEGGTAPNEGGTAQNNAGQPAVLQVSNKTAGQTQNAHTSQAVAESKANTGFEREDNAANNNVLRSEQMESPQSVLRYLGNDFYWVGKNESFANKHFVNDFLAAGETVSVYSCNSEGSMRIAGFKVSLDACAVQETITLAGYDVQVNETAANAIALAGKTVSFNGETNTLVATGNRVVLDGVVHGDARISAMDVVFSEDARVEGTLYLEAPTQPRVNPSNIANMEFVQIEDSVSDNIVLFKFGNWSLELSEAATFIGFLLTHVIFGLLGVIIIALLAEWLFRKQTVDSAAMLRQRTGAMIGSGIVAAILAPFVLILLCMLVITLPVAGALALALAAIQVVGLGFMAASLAKLVLPRMGRFKGTLLSALVFAAIACLPIVGTILSIAGFMYLLGYVVQSIYWHFKLAKLEREEAKYAENVQASAVSATPAGSV